jgi:nucleoside-diphosphate-sugar epimerase
MKSDKYGVANWLIRQNLDHKPITVFGDGKLKRDFVYVDDVVDALLMLPTNRNTYGQIFNIGHTEVSNFSELAQLIIKISNQGSVEYTKYSKERADQEPGDFYSDISKIYQYIGWKPTISLRKGLIKTIQYYEKYKKFYW